MLILFINLIYFFQANSTKKKTKVELIKDFQWQTEVTVDRKTPDKSIFKQMSFFVKKKKSIDF